VRYQWFWAGTQDESGRLSSDLKHAVKRHAVVKRIVPVGMIEPLPHEAVDEAETADDIIEGPSKKDNEEIDEEEEAEEREEGIERQERDGPNSSERDNQTTVDNADPDDEARRKAKVVYTWNTLLDFSFSAQVRT
jgi:hypothetical protein